MVFDLDGTLMDSAPEIQGIANSILKEEGYDPFTLLQARDFIGYGVAVFVLKLRAARGIPEPEHDRLLAEFVSRYHGATALTQMYPGVATPPETLVAAGHVLGVCTNKPIAATKAVLTHLPLDTYFDTIIGGDSLPVNNPDAVPDT